MDVLDWLLQDDNPGVQYLTRARLLGESPRSRRTVALRRNCNQCPPVAPMLRCAAPTPRLADRVLAAQLADRSSTIH
ncbi:MAG: hypothetical protein PVI86_10015 [Phycisphaerae bacterium]